MSEPSLPNTDPETLRRWDREHLWHAFTQMAEHEPLILVEGRGCTLVDDEGREYLDGVSNLWCNLHGHRHPRIDEAVRRQLDEIAHVTLLGAAHPTTIRLARRLVELAPEGLRHVFFSSDGSSSIEAALKLAFQYWRQCPDPRPEKTTFIALEGAYHGDTLGSASVGGVALFHEQFRPLLFPSLRAPCPDTYRLPEGVDAERALEHYLGALESLLEREHQQVAAVVVEPLMQCAAGMVRHPPGFLRGVRELTRRHEVLLIADEVAVGLGRSGRLFACEHEQVAPDFLCLAKGLTGGYLPLAATLASAEIWRAFLGRHDESRHFYHGHTYSGNPLAAAAALATLEVFDEERVLERLPERIAQLGRRLERLAGLPHVGDTRQLGLIGAVELVADRERRLSYPAANLMGRRVCQAARRLGVLLRPLGDVVVIMPPLCVTEDELDRICDAIESGLAEV